MSMRRYVIILSILFLGACAREEGFHALSFQEEKKADLKVIGDPLEVGVPVDLCFQGDHIFVLAYSQKYWLHIYDKETGKLVSESIQIGRGPGEGLNFVSMDYREDEHSLYIYDMNLRKTVIYNLDGEAGTAKFEREFGHPSEGVIRKCYTLPDGLFLYEGYLPGGDKFVRLTLSDGISPLDTYSEYPGVDNDDDKYAFMLGVSKSDPANGRYVSGTMFGAVLEFFDVTGNTIQCHSLRLIEPPEMDMSGQGIKAKQGVNYGFVALCIDGDLIFANYMGTDDADEFKSIVSFDWNGNEKVKYVADQNILRLCPGEKKGKELYCIASSPESEFSLAKLTLD